MNVRRILEYIHMWGCEGLCLVRWFFSFEKPINQNQLNFVEIFSKFQKHKQIFKNYKILFGFENINQMDESKISRVNKF